MKSLIRFILFFIITFAPYFSFAEGSFEIINWEENTSILASGKTSDVYIQGQIKNLPRNMAMTSFAISFSGGKRQIAVSKAMCDGKEVQFSFSNNVLEIKFPQAKRNGAPILLFFSYREYYPEIHESLRQEVINIPPFAEGANARVSLNFPSYMESATLNPNIMKSGNSFIYSNIVPKEGVQEIVKLTESQNAWDVAVRIKAISDKAPNKFSIRIPDYFQTPRQQVENYTTLSSIMPMRSKTVQGAKLLQFDSGQKEVLIESKAKVTTGENARKALSYRPDNYLKISQEETDLLSPILDEIKSNQKYRGLPLHAKIGKFVNEFIKYDLSYGGKLPPLKEILRSRIGVCTEFARLYNSLARLAQIPSLMIEGAACGEYKDCRGHSWNVIYVDGKWIEVDPTWNLMSGIVSSSHIYFNDSGQGEVTTEYFNDNKVRLELDFEMKKSL